MATRWGRQDARHVPVQNLDEYNSDDQLADLGQARHEALPLAGKGGRVKTPPPPDPKKLGRLGLRLSRKTEDVIAAWGNLHEETLEEQRADGLGGGQAHRTGENFRPINHGPRRTRSVSPPRRVGNTLKLGTRPVINAQQGNKRAPAPLPQYGMTARSVKPREQVRAALDDAVIHRPFVKPVKAQEGDLNHWHAGRIAIARDNLDFFGGGKVAPGMLESIHAPKPGDQPTAAPKTAPKPAPKPAPQAAPKPAPKPAAPEPVKKENVHLKNIQGILNKEAKARAPDPQQSKLPPHLQTKAPNTGLAQPAKPAGASPHMMNIKKETPPPKPPLVKSEIKPDSVDNRPAPLSSPAPSQMRSRIVVVGNPPPKKKLESVQEFERAMMNILDEKEALSFKCDIEQDKLTKLEEEEKLLDARLKALQSSKQVVNDQIDGYTHKIKVLETKYSDLRDKKEAAEKAEAERIATHEALEDQKRMEQMRLDRQKREDERKRLIEEERREEQKRFEEKNRLEEEKRIEMQKRVEEQRLEEQKRLEEEKRREEQRLEQEKRLEGERQEQRRQEEKLQEERREEQKRQEEQRQEQKRQEAQPLGRSTPFGQAYPTAQKPVADRPSAGLMLSMWAQPDRQRAAAQTNAPRAKTPQAFPAKDSSTLSTASTPVQPSDTFRADSPSLNFLRPNSKEEGFRRANPLSKIDHAVDPNTGRIFPYQVRLDLRPFLEYLEPFSFSFTATDVPNSVIKKALKQTVRSDAEYREVADSDAFKEWRSVVHKRFFLRMARGMNGV